MVAPEEWLGRVDIVSVSLARLVAQELLQDPERMVRATARAGLEQARASAARAASLNVSTLAEGVQIPTRVNRDPSLDV